MRLAPHSFRKWENTLLDYRHQSTRQMGFYEEKDTIGKRYRRMDALGTPFCVTVDHQTKDDQTVTIRYRDSMTQERIPLADVMERVMKEIRMF